MTAETTKILVVDDDWALLGVLEAGLKIQPENEVTAVSKAPEALVLAESRDFDIVITDYQLRDEKIDGMSILRAVRRRNEKTLVIIITAYASLEVTLESIHWGAHDFLTKPFQLDELKLVVRNATERIRLERENGLLRRQVEQLVLSLDEIQQQQGELMDRLSHLSEDSGGTEGAALSLAGASVLELRRRKLREQVSSYIRMGETIRERLQRERENIDAMFKKGMLSEEAYRRAIQERQQAPGA